MTLAQREEIAIMHAVGASNAEIARAIGVHRSTIGRELARGSTVIEDRRPRYRASMAQTRAEWRAAKGGRSQQTKLSQHPDLVAEVQARLEAEHSPEEIAGRLRKDFPDRPEMWVSHETIYKELYVQGRGTLRRDLHQRLRTGRALRKTRRSTGERRGRIAGMVNIAERPAEVEDRAVPGDWEGDLITGASNKSAIGTLVERSSGFVMLLHLPEGHGADAVAEAMIEAMSRLPEVLRRTLTWDQGVEMTNHVQIAAALDLDIYFCDPHSPWQRGTNENTNGLLRQYFPKSSDLSIYAPDYLDHVARKLNNRPRKRHDWDTPAEVLDRLLSHPPKHGVADAG
ncbi:IS30 family transposase [Nocardioides sp. GY 10127]|uniref:IS30 family transposase n=1 Tax=Nocardioides sp. GY 10127 TaxID=2569762 RepID=UPI0010A7ACDE|nr:IS30 family transposase [Nocardioides sp. GY 10127]TIC78512.1 IS30 family transposase [Nocardioides sp. GY 10127]